MVRLMSVCMYMDRSGHFEMHTNLMDTNPEYFWKCFLRVMQCLQRAQHKLGARQEELTNEQEEEIEIAELEKMISTPKRIALDDILDQKSQLPFIKNIVGRLPGRGIPVRQWDKFDPQQEIFELQRQYQMPEPFFGRADAVLHLISCLQTNRLTSIVGEWGSGKTLVARALLHTIQSRSADSADGRYLYRDGVFNIACDMMMTVNQLIFVTAGTVGRLTMDLNEVVMAIREKNCLFVLDGVDGIMANENENLLFKAFLEKLLEGVPGVSIVCTCVAPMGVPYENVVGITRLSDSELAALVRKQGYADFHSGEQVCKFMYGNPFKAMISAALFQDGMHGHEMYEVMDTHWKMHLKKLSVGEFDPDPWLDPIKVHYTKNGKKVGNNLSMRAWIEMALGSMEKTQPNAFSTIYLLAFLPAGLDYLDFTQSHHGIGVQNVLHVIWQQYKLVELVDVNGDEIHGVNSTKEYFKYRGGKGFVRLRPSVRQIILDLGVEFPEQSLKSLRMVLNSLQRQAEVINGYGDAMCVCVCVCVRACVCV